MIAAYIIVMPVFPTERACAMCHEMVTIYHGKPLVAIIKSNNDVEPMCDADAAAHVPRLFDMVQYGRHQMLT